MPVPASVFFDSRILIFFDFSRLLRLVAQVASGKGPEVPSEYSTRNVGSKESWKMQNNTTVTEGEGLRTSESESVNSNKSQVELQVPGVFVPPGP